jgi:hypothetical protein
MFKSPLHKSVSNKTFFLLSGFSIEQRQSKSSRIDATSRQSRRSARSSNDVRELQHPEDVALEEELDGVAGLQRVRALRQTSRRRQTGQHEERHHSDKVIDLVTYENAENDARKNCRK